MAAQSEIGAAGSLVTETAPQTVVATQPNGIQGPQGSGSSRTGVDVALPSSAHPGGPAASQPLQPTTNASNSISGTTEKVLGADSASRAAGSGSPHTEGEGNSPQDSKPDDSAPHSSLLDNSKVVGDSQGSQGTQAGAQGPQGGQTQVPVSLAHHTAHQKQHFLRINTVLERLQCRRVSDHDGVRQHCTSAPSTLPSAHLQR